MDVELELIISESNGLEAGYIPEATLDMEIGDVNDFELEIPLESWNEEKYEYGNRIYIPDTEYGGLLEDLSVNTKNNEVTWTGYTWRGLLSQKIVEPPEGADHLVLNGELNTVIKQLVGNRFGDLVVVDDEVTDVILNNWQVDRYVTLYAAIMKILDAYGYRLNIAYRQEEYPDTGAVHLRATKVADYSDDIEYSQDGQLYFTVRDYRMGINHLICLGTGQNEERIVLHLYVQKDGSIGTTQYYTGLAERTAVYDYSTAEADKLQEDGMKKLQELMNYTSVSVSVADTDLEIGDIIGGYEEVTGITVKQPVTGKILRIEDEKATIEYKVKGAE